MALRNLRDIEMELRQRAANQRRMADRQARGSRRSSDDGIAAQAIAAITNDVMRNLSSSGITKSNNGYSMQDPGRGTFIQGNKSVAKAKSGETVVAKPETTEYRSETHTREPATITVGGKPYNPGQVIPGTVTGQVSPFDIGQSQNGATVPSGGVSGSPSGTNFPAMDDSYAGLAQGSSLLTEGSLAKSVSDFLSKAGPVSPPPPPPASVALEQRAGNQFQGWQTNTTPTPTGGIPDSSGGMRGGVGVAPGIKGGIPSYTATPAGSYASGGTYYPEERGNVSTTTPTGGPTGAGGFNDSINLGNVEGQTGVPASAVYAIMGLENGNQNLVGKTTTLRNDVLALDSGIFQSTAESHGLDFNKIVNDPEYAAYAAGALLQDYSNDDAGKWGGTPGMTVAEYSQATFGNPYVGAARIYFGGCLQDGCFVDEQGRSVEEYGQQFADAMGGYLGVPAESGGDFSGRGPGGGRDTANMQQPTYQGQGPGGGRDVNGNFPGAIGYIEPTSQTAPPDQSGQAIAANTSDPGFGNQVANLADNYVGVNYVLGSSPNSTQDPYKNGWDCSGFIWYIADTYGVSSAKSANGIPQGSHFQYEWAKKNGKLRDVGSVQPGDIIYFNSDPGKSLCVDPSNGCQMNNASHVGIYLGNGKFIQALNESQGTVISDLNDYWLGQALGVSSIY